MKPRKLTYMPVKEIGGGWTVKTQYRGGFYTAAETYCIPGRMDAKQMAEVLALLLNQREQALISKN